MTHLENVEKYDGTLEELAVDVANLRYDKIGEFIRHLSNEILNQSLNDKSNCLYTSSGYLRLVWDICEPYMRPKK